MEVARKTEAPAAHGPPLEPPRDILAGSGVVYFRWDLKTGEFTDIGGAVESVFGYTADEFLALPHMAPHVTHPDFARKVPRLMAEWSLEQPKQVRFEGHYLAKDGREIWLMVSGAAEYAPSGEVAEVKALAQDVTPLVLGRRAAEDGRHLYVHLFRNAPMPLILYDPDTLLVVDANAFACATYGMAHPEFCGTFFDERIAGEEWPRREDRLRDGGAGKPVQIIPRMMHKKGDGTAFPVQLVTVSLSESGRSLRLAVVRDLTESELAESSLRLLRTALEAVAAPVVLLDRDRRVVFLNPAAEEVTGASFADMQGQDFSGSLAQGWERTWRTALSVATRGGTWRGKIVLHGVPRPRGVSVELQPVHTFGASVSHYIAVLHKPPMGGSARAYR